MRRTVRALALVSSLALAGCAPEGAGDGDGADTLPADSVAAAADSGTADDSAAVLASRLVQAMGGRAAWDSTRFLAFDWVVARGEGQEVRRSHAWDRWEGTYRVEWDQDGESRVAIFETDELRRDSALGKVPEGEVWGGGEQLSGAAADSALHRAYAIFINDSYWLLMPYKWRDPGVHLEHAGRDTMPDGTVAPGVHLTFDEDLGVTNDQYWAWVDPETGLMEAWQYHLQDQEEPGAVIRWEGWRRVGPIMLATERVWPDGAVNIRFENLRASAEVPEEAFESPSGSAGPGASTESPGPES